MARYNGDLFDTCVYSFIGDSLFSLPATAFCVIKLDEESMQFRYDMNETSPRTQQPTGPWGRKIARPVDFSRRDCYIFAGWNHRCRPASSCPPGITGNASGVFRREDGGSEGTSACYTGGRDFTNAAGVCQGLAGGLTLFLQAAQIEAIDNGEYDYI